MSRLLNTLTLPIGEGTATFKRIPARDASDIAYALTKGDTTDDLVYSGLAVCKLLELSLVSLKNAVNIDGTTVNFNRTETQADTEFVLAFVKSGSEGFKAALTMAAIVAMKTLQPNLTLVKSDTTH
jgi:hypothetical protein